LASVLIFDCLRSRRPTACHRAGAARPAGSCGSPQPRDGIADPSGANHRYADAGCDVILLEFPHLLHFPPPRVIDGRLGRRRLFALSLLRPFVAMGPGAVLTDSSSPTFAKPPVVAARCL